MPTVQQLGSFRLTSPKVVVIDPGYSIDTAETRHGGCFVARCRLGEWRVDVAMDRPSANWWPDWRSLPCSLTAIHSQVAPEFMQSAKWLRVADEVGQDGGLIGIFDAAQYDEMRSIPDGHGSAAPDGDTRKLWYEFVSEVIGDSAAAVLPHGAVVSWDGGMDVDSVSTTGEVVGIRLSISGWPNPYEENG